MYVYACISLGGQIIFTFKVPEGCIEIARANHLHISELKEVILEVGYRLCKFSEKNGETFIKDFHKEKKESNLLLDSDELLQKRNTVAQEIKNCLVFYKTTIYFKDSGADRV